MVPFGGLLESPVGELPMLLLSEEELSKARTLSDNRRRVVKFLGRLAEEIDTLELVERAASERGECVYSEEGFSVSEDMADFGSMVEFSTTQNPNPPLMSTVVSEEKEDSGREGLRFSCLLKF